MRWPCRSTRRRSSTTPCASPRATAPRRSVLSRAPSLEVVRSRPWRAPLHRIILAAMTIRGAYGSRARRATSLRDSDERHGIDEAVGQHEVAVPRDRGVAHDVAATWDRPALELLGLGIEAHDRVRCRSRLAVPDGVVDGRDAIGLGLRPARRRPFRDLAGRGMQATEITAREVAVQDKVVTRDRDAPGARCSIRPP